MLLLAAGALLAALVGDQLHVANYRFLWRTNIIEEIRSKATAGGQFPSVWMAFFNSLALALSQTVIILTVASLVRLLHFPLRLPRARGVPAGPARAARVSGDDADHSDLPDPALGRTARYDHRRHARARHDRAAVLRIRDEGLFRRGAVGHRDERDDRRRDPPPGVSPGRAAAGARGPDRRRACSPSSAPGRSTSSSARC